MTDLHPTCTGCRADLTDINGRKSCTTTGCQGNHSPRPPDAEDRALRVAIFAGTLIAIAGIALLLLMRGVAS